MSDLDEKNDDSLPLGDLERIDKVCSQFEESWKAGNPDRIEELLEGFAGQVRDELLLELLLLEFDYRSQPNTDVPIDEYRQQFPDDLDIVDQAIEQSSHDQTILTPGQSVDTHLIPERIRYLGDYEILEEIARGGMGIVFKARQSTLGRIVAVKMMLTGQLSTGDQISRFEREAKLAGRLQHPNIVAVHEVGRHEGMPYFSMDFVDGESLSEMVRDNPLPPRDAVRYLQVAADTIHKAHEEGILHRDLKPSNILIDCEDRVRITDFGLAKVIEEGESLTPTASGIGTPSYMPPEQVVGNKALIGVRSDVYSLGAVLYELLTGRPPFAAATAVETMHQVMTKEPVSPRVLNSAIPRDLETICLKCLGKEPNQRYSSAKELQDELSRYLSGQPITARPIGMLTRFWKWYTHNITVIAASAVIFTSLLLLLLSVIGALFAYGFEVKHANSMLFAFLGTMLIAATGFLGGRFALKGSRFARWWNVVFLLYISSMNLFNVVWNWGHVISRERSMVPLIEIADPLRSLSHETLFATWYLIAFLVQMHALIKSTSPNTGFGDLATKV